MDINKWVDNHGDPGSFDDVPEYVTGYAEVIDTKTVYYECYGKIQLYLGMPLEATITEAWRVEHDRKTGIIVDKHRVKITDLPDYIVIDAENQMVQEW